jgi:hypothetical protein
MGPQLVSLHFAGSGFGQLGKKFHPMRALINGQTGNDEILQFASQLRGCGSAHPQHYTGGGLEEFVIILPENDCDFQDRCVLT